MRELCSRRHAGNTLANVTVYCTRVSQPSLYTCTVRLISTCDQRTFAMYVRSTYHWHMTFRLIHLLRTFPSSCRRRIINTSKQGTISSTYNRNRSNGGTNGASAAAASYDSLAEKRSLALNSTADDARSYDIYEAHNR